jgi:transcriptional regulator with XRE-family HTH domain
MHTQYCAYRTQFVLLFDNGLECGYDHHRMKPEPIYKTIGAIIRRRRRRLDWPQARLASRLGISRATLANIETGRQRVLVHHLYTFAEVLDMKPSDFLPPANLAESPGSWALLPIPDDLKPQQKEQIARLIGPSHQTTSKSKERNNDKSAKTNRRSPR